MQNKNSRINKSTKTQPISWKHAENILNLLEIWQKWNTLLMFAFGFYFGLRIGDILKLKWKNILDENFKPVESFNQYEEKTTKESQTNKFRSITIHEKVKYYINIVLNNKKEFPPLDSYIFIHQRSDGNPYKHISVVAANKRIKNVFLKTGIKVANPSSHTLRKTFARRVYEFNGKSESALIQLSEILNHSSPSITRKYIGITDEMIKDIYLSI